MKSRLTAIVDEGLSLKEALFNQKDLPLVVEKKLRIDLGYKQFDEKTNENENT